MHSLAYTAWIAAMFELYQGCRPQYRVTDSSGFEKSITAWEIGLLCAGYVVLLSGMVVERRIGHEAWEMLDLDLGL